MYKLDDQIALVTGASRGIGRAISLALAQAGANVVLVSRSAADLEQVAEEIGQAGGMAEVHVCDVTDAVSVTGMIKEINSRHGALHILVNNAGTTRDNLVLRMSDEEWSLPLDINLKGAFNTIRAATRYMLKQRYGRIINITSIVGVSGNAGQANYAASKAGLIGMTKSIAKELASRNITVNAVGPGYINTDLTGGLTEQVKNKLIEAIPLGRLGQPEDVAPAVVFLASEAAGYITGQTLLVDGGMVM